MKSTGEPVLHVVSIPPPSALAAHPFPAEHVVFGAGPQAQLLRTLREAPLAVFPAEDLGWELAPKAPIPVKLAGTKDLDWHLDPTEMEL